MGRFERNRSFNYNRHDDKFKINVDIPNFNGDLNIEGFLDWLTKVDRFFEYTELPEDRKVKFVSYRLKGRASMWWDRSREKRMREGCDLVQTWCRMKQLLQGRFLPLDYEQYISYSYKRCIHGSKRVNEYPTKYLRLT